MTKDQSGFRGVSSSIWRQRGNRVRLHGLDEMGMIGELYGEEEYESLWVLPESIGLSLCELSVMGQESRWVNYIETHQNRSGDTGQSNGRWPDSADRVEGE